MNFRHDGATMSAMTTDAEGPASLVVSRDDRAGRLVFVLEGDIDLETSRQLRAELLAAIETGDEDVVVDLSGVGFMDSSGLAALVGGWKAVRDHGSFRVCGPNAVVHRVLTITGMEDVFDIRPDVPSALAAG